MGLNTLKKKLQDNVEAAKGKMPQLDTDALKRQMEEKVTNAKTMAENLGNSATALGAKAAEGVGKGIDHIKTTASQASESIGQAFDAASANAKTALESCGKSMDQFKAEVIDHIGDYAKQFSESGLWDKLAQFAKRAGAKLVYIVLCLYYALDTMPVKEKFIVMGALGYFIFPTDAIPDIMPGIGFSDDLAALLAIFRGLHSSISPKSVERAEEKLTEWFGDVSDMDLPRVDELSEEDVTAAADIMNNAKQKGMTKTATKLLGKEIKKRLGK